MSEVFRWQDYYPQIAADYSKTGEKSVDGDSDQAILDMLKDWMCRRVLDVAAGDGVYDDPLLRNGNSVFAGDYKIEPLIAARNKLSPDLRERYYPFRMDAFSPFPFSDQEFDGVICTRFLYLFPEEMLQGVFAEFGRVIKPGGVLIFDFATEIRRERPDSSLVETKVNYSLDEGWETISRLLRTNFILMRHSTTNIHQDLTGSGQPGYTMTNKKINIMGERLRNNT